MTDFFRQKRLAVPLLLSGLLIAVLLLIHFLHTPSHEGPWQTAQQRLPEIRMDNDSVQIKQLRDFRYYPDGQIREARYQQQEYSLAALHAVWFGISHFSENGLAHTFLSFEFANGDYLVASVEARMRPAQTYHPMQGLLRQYHKIIVLGTEADIIGLRSHVRGERVLLYPLQLNAEQRRHLLRGIIADAQAISTQPVFYNTLLDNCTTSLLRHDPQHRLWRDLLDYRVLLPGYSDAYAQQRGWLEPERDLRQWRREVRVDANAAPDDANFSQQIRSPHYQRLSLSLLLLQQDMYQGQWVHSSGVVRGFADPEHYWIEDNQLRRVAIEPSALALPWLGQVVEVFGRFQFYPEQGRLIELDAIRPLAQQQSQ
ncbi:MAG: DUF4105 domain-containing protein [Gammaproteobacteria bacterium]|nr:DUF4105 domain-containing protein [Gammaproteobacteria bacterium]